jgi:hypothetical protein
MAPGRVVLGRWVGSVILFVFAFVLLAAYRAEVHSSRKRVTN